MSTENEQLDETPPATEPAADETTTAADEERSMDDRLAEAVADRDAHYDRFLRAQAELENYRRRTQKERSDDARYASARLARDLLPVVDNLDRAIEAAGRSTETADLVEGVQLVAKQLHDTLDSHEIKPIATESEMFDPNLHEALTQVPSPDHPPMAIVQEVERGYMLHDRVLRPAKVVVSSGPATGDAVAEA